MIIRNFLLWAMLCILAFSQELTANETIQIQSKIKQLSAPEAASYQWYLNGEKLSNGQSQNLRIEKSGTYTVQLTDIMGQTRTQTIMVTVNASGVRKILVIGDSTASEYSSDLFPRTGWAQVFQPFFNSDSVVVYDYALSGRSSRSFYSDSDGWPKVMPKIDSGDFLFIQFGHNDSKTDERYTEPSTTFKEYLSIYIDTALARGAYPVLLTPIERNKNWSGGVMTSTTHGDYPEAMRELAIAKDIPLIDMTIKTRTRWNELGEDYTTNNIYNNLEAGVYPNYTDGNEDNTHLQEEGAWEVCKLVSEGITEQKDTTTLGLLFNNMNSTGYVKVLPFPYLSASFSGTGIFASGTETEIIPNTLKTLGLDKWYIDDQVVSEDLTFSYTVGDTMVYIQATYKTGYLVDLAKTKGGSVSGEDYYISGREVTIVATPRDGYEFIGWVDADEDTVTTDSAYTITVATEDLYFQAVFQEIASAISSDNIKALNIYPNPATDKLLIESETEIKQISVLSVNGQKVTEQKINQTSFTLPLSVQPGMYILNVYFEDAVQTRKFMVE